MHLRNWYNKTLSAVPDRLHFAAHSHHPWPDVTRDAALQSWDLSSQELDAKWGTLFSKTIPEAQRSLLELLGVPNAEPDQIAIAPNTFELVVRLMSCLEGFGSRPLRILTTDSEFHSFERQIRRLEEAGWVQATRVPIEPYATFLDRFTEAARSSKEKWDWGFLSHVFFTTGYHWGAASQLTARLEGIESITHTPIVIDGYHALGAIPVTLADASDRFFYLGGGYKYLQAGEGACFVYCPKRFAEHLRPVFTGWMSHYGSLREPRSLPVRYGPYGMALIGATFDATPWLRFNAVMKLWRTEFGDLNQAVLGLRKKVSELQGHFESRWNTLGLGNPEILRPQDRGSFLAFRHPRAQELARTLQDHQIFTDARDPFWRVGFGVYQSPEGIERLIKVVRELW